MAVARMRRFRRVGFGESRMPTTLDPAAFHSTIKRSTPLPAVKADHQNSSKDAVHLTSAGLQPFVGDVTGKRASLTVMQTNQMLWRIGQNKIDSIIGHASHELNAITRRKRDMSGTPLVTEGGRNGSG